MKLKELSEMTQRFGKAGENLPNALEFIWNNRKYYKHVGDINQTNVLYKDNIYLLKSKDSEPVGFFQVFKEKDTALVQNMYVVPGYRKQGWMSMFLFFLKRNESYSRIQLGSQHSSDTVEAVKRIYKMFNDVYWEKDGKREPYDPKTIDKYYSIAKKTGWNIIMENEHEYPGYPKFWDNTVVLQNFDIQYDIHLDLQDYYD